MIKYIFLFSVVASVAFAAHFTVSASEPIVDHCYPDGVCISIYDHTGTVAMINRFSTYQDMLAFFTKAWRGGDAKYDNKHRLLGMSCWNGSFFNVKYCENGADNYPECTLPEPTCDNGADNYPACSLDCDNGAIDYPSCSIFPGDVTPPPDNDGLAITSCYPDPPTAAQEETVTWHSVVSGGKEPYTYSWSGTEGLTGDTPSVEKSYVSQGSKVAALRVTDADDNKALQICIALAVNGNGPILSVDKHFVRVGEQVDVSWDVGTDDPASCTIVNTGSAPHAPANSVGNQTVNLSGGTVIFTITCPSGSDSETVRVLPVVQES